MLAPSFMCGGIKVAKPFVKMGDTVKVMTGKDTGKTGKVIRVLKARERIVIEGINMIRKHVRPNPQKNVKGGIVEREAPIHQSNVKVISQD